MGRLDADNGQSPLIGAESVEEKNAMDGVHQHDAMVGFGLQAERGYFFRKTAMGFGDYGQVLVGDVKILVGFVKQDDSVVSEESGQRHRGQVVLEKVQFITNGGQGVVQ